MGIHGFISFVRSIHRSIRERLREIENGPMTELLREEMDQLLIKLARIEAINKRHPKEKLKSLYIDANSLCYKALDPIYGWSVFDVEPVRKSIAETSEDALILKGYEAIWTMLRELIEAHDVSYVMIAFDGPVNLAKLHQQRQRRYESGLSLTKETVFDRSSITPGTPWMHGLDIYLKNAILNYINSGGEFVPDTIDYSSHEVPGEGEHKIMDMIKARPSDEAIGIYGQDSDLYLLSLARFKLDRVRSIYIIASPASDFISDHLKRYKKYIGAEQLKSYMKNFDPSYFNIIKFCEYLEEIAEAREPDNRANFVLEFIICMSFVGNDFIPRPIALLDLTVACADLLTDLAQIKQPIYHDGVIIWSGVLEFLTAYAKREYGYIREYQPFREVSPHRCVEGAYVQDDEGKRWSPEKFRELWYCNALLPKSSNVARKLLFTMTDVSEMCFEFLRGVQWTKIYYFDGQDSVPNDWYYPYFYAPLLQDLVTSLRFLVENKMTKVLSVGAPNRKIKVEEQLVSVMHPRALRQVPRKLHVLWSEESSIRDLHPNAFVVDKDWLAPNKVLPEEISFVNAARSDYYKYQVSTDKIPGYLAVDVRQIGYATDSRSSVKPAKGFYAEESAVIFSLRSEPIPDELEKYLVANTAEILSHRFKIQCDRLVEASLDWTGVKILPWIDLPRIEAELKRFKIPLNEPGKTVRYARPLLEKKKTAARKPAPRGPTRGGGPTRERERGGGRGPTHEGGGGRGRGGGGGRGRDPTSEREREGGRGERLNLRLGF